MLSFQVEKMFDDKTFDLLKNFILSETSDSESMKYQRQLGRYYKMLVFPNDLKEMIVSKTKQYAKNKDLDVGLFHVVKYQIKDGIVPSLEEHTDNNIGNCVVSIVIEKTIDWPLIVEGKEMVCSENSAVFIMGEQDKHSRASYPSQSKNDFLLLLFLHMDPKNSQLMKTSKAIHSLDEKNAKLLLNLINPVDLYSKKRDYLK